MGWLHKANAWLRRPFARAAATRIPARKLGDRSGRATGPGKHAAGTPHLPADTDVTVRHIFSLTNPGIVKPHGDGVPERVIDPQTDHYVELVLEHFLANRPDPASFPEMATRVIDTAEQLDADLSHLARLIEGDAAISAKVLQVANSALYHRDFEIGSIKAAVGHLGMFAVANVAVSVACRSLYDSAARSEYDLYPRLWKELFLQSATVAYAASQFSTERRTGRPDQVFLAGMFHDIGKTLALRSLCGLIIEGKVPHLDDTQVSYLLEQLHVRVGTEAHTAWQLPQFLATVCRRHHDDDVVPTADYDELHLIRVVSGLNALRLSSSFDRRLSRQVRASVHALGITLPQLRALTSSIREMNEHVFQLFSGRS